MKQYKWHFERQRLTSTLVMGELGEFLHSDKNACFPQGSGTLRSSLQRFYWSNLLEPFDVTYETPRSKAQPLSVTFTEALERKQDMCTAIPPLLNIYANLLRVSNKSNYQLICRCVKAAGGVY